MSSQKLPQIVEVEWVDSISALGWRSRKDRIADTNSADMKHRTAGYLLASKKDWVLVTHSLGDHIDNACESIQIPRRAITSIRKLTR